MNIKIIKEEIVEDNAGTGSESQTTDVTVLLHKQNRLLKSLVFLLALLIILGFGIGAYAYTNTQSLVDRFRSDVSGQIATIARAGNLAPRPEPPLPPADIQLGAGVPFLGNPDAKVLVVEYADFQCPFCGRFHEQVYGPLKTEYIDTGKVKFVYQDFAFLGQESKQAAQAVKCAGEQGKFWEYHDYLFNNQDGENLGTFADKNLKKFAQTLKLSTSKFNACLDSGKFQALVDQETSDGRDYGVSGTPTTFVNGKPFVGAQPYATFKQAIDAALAE